MRKLFFLAGLSALALTGCVSDNEVDVQPQFNNAITFENVVNKATRALVPRDLTNENLNRFLVYGYYTPATSDGVAISTPIEIFNSEEVTRSWIEADKKWTPWTYNQNDVRYWIPGATYYFYAYSCGDIALNPEFGAPQISYTNEDSDSRVLRLTDYICCQDHQHDLIYAMQEGLVGKEKVGGTVENPTAGTKQSVKFQFKHILSRLEVIFSSAMPSEYQVVISNVRIEKVRNHGSFNPKTGWTVYSPNENFSRTIKLDVDEDKDDAVPEIKVGDTVIQEKMDVLTAEGYALPFKYENDPVELKFTYTLIKNGTTAMTRDMTGTFKPEWLQGHNYRYAISINGVQSGLEEITFDTIENTVDGWDSGSTDNVEITFTSSDNTGNGENPETND